MLEHGKIITNSLLQDSYYKIEFDAPGISSDARPGQFVHLQVTGMRDRVLRRPFSICNADKDTGVLTIVYKIVGRGTEALSELPAGSSCSLMGPQGNAFSVPAPEEYPVIIAGGYGSAATYLIAKEAPAKGHLLLGAKTKKDLILADEYKKLSFDVLTSTEDGSSGKKGLVTELIDPILQELEEKKKKLKFYVCGPTGMIYAVGGNLLKLGYDPEVSLDHVMCCGVGACFACVVKVRDESTENGWRYARTCKEGPVFKADELCYECEKENL